MPNSNSEISWRSGSGIQYSPDMPEWLRRQFEWRVDSEGPSQGYWVAPDLIRDEDGNEIVMADDRGDLMTGGERALKPGAKARWVPGLGWAVNATDTESTGKYERRTRRNRAIAGTVIGGAALGGLAASGAFSGAGAAAGGGTGSGLAATIPADLAVGGSATAPAYTLAEIPSIVGAGGGSAAAGGAGLAGLGQAAGGGGGLAASIPGDLAVGGTSAGSSVALDAMPAIAQAGGSGGGLVNSLGGYGNIARGLAGLGMAASSGGGGSGGGAGTTNPMDIINTMANINRVDHTTPIGSRRWSQDENGRWSVTDSMSPAEQANFEQVQGLNAGVTGMARDRLAALLSAGPRKRYDRPLGS